MEIFPLLESDPRSWALMPAALARVKTFAIFHEPDEVPDDLCRRVRMAFAANDPVYTILVGLKDGKIVGHSLLVVEQYGPKRVVTVQQYALDQGSGVTGEMVKEQVRITKRVARSLGATEIRAKAKDEARVRAFARYGFRPFATLLTQSAEE
jgi:hypothetical protein